MKILVVASGLLLCVAMATAQAPQAPPVTPMKFAYYSAADIKALNNTVKGGGQIMRGGMLSMFVTTSMTEPVEELQAPVTLRQYIPEEE